MKYLEPKKLILIGASTGGPAHIEKIATVLPENFGASIVVAQHMGNEFIPSFAKRLNERSKLTVSQAREGDTLHAGCLYIVSEHAEIIQNGEHLTFCIKTNPHAHFNPDINTLFLSAAHFVGRCEILAFILTGIGDDGVDGCVRLEQEGARCIAESEKTAVVYGMPARAKERGANIHAKDLHEIIEIIKQFGA
ncbi:MAG: CheB methylesterase domain-containing protein [Thiovulaceae bacterium]|nr:CheB methylesterase domain-containing protein [Sulfurimonadaceae bacterium]